MKTIGQFAKENNVTVKTLHHYEKVELITPYEIDNETGYRYYSKKEKDELVIVLFLKSLGFSLTEIKEIKDSNDMKLLEKMMTYKENQAKKDIETSSMRLHKLEIILDVLKDDLKTIGLEELIKMSVEQNDTGKYGRGVFIEEVDKAFNKAKQNNTPLCFVSMDLDRFHDVNKRFGYDVGDVVLKRTGDIIVSVLQKQKYSSLMNHSGGDEYSVVVETGMIEASKLVTEILNEVVEVDYSDIADGLKVAITAGIASVTNKMKVYQDLMHEATIKLYESKKSRR